MGFRYKRFSWSVTEHCVNKYKERVKNGPEKKDASANHIRKIIKRNLNYAIKNSNLEEILELEGEKRIIPLKFTKGGETFYAITKQKEVITLYNEEMYNNDLKWRADKISNKYYSSYATT